MGADPDKLERGPDISSAGESASPEHAGSRRRLVETRCGFADMARREADAASTRAMEARRHYDERLQAVIRAEAAVDPVAAHAAKDEAHRAFRAAVASARGYEQVEAAANSWLAEINKVNARVRATEAAVRRERDAVRALQRELTELYETAESSATMAAEAMKACQAAQAAFEAESSGGAEAALPPAAGSGLVSVAESPAGVAAAGPVAVPGATLPPPAPARLLAPAPVGPEPIDGDQPGDWLVIDIRSSQPQAVIRLMRRDGAVFAILVDRLAGRDPAARSCWQLLLSNFVDAVAAAAIEDAWLEFGQDVPFWSQFTPDEAREVARGLAALGFRFDGFGSFVGGRLPSQRDLALAVGAAGLLPVRIRRWPAPDEAAALFSGARPAGDAFIAAGAPALTLGELVRLLGRRAEPLADLWNDWDRVRPLLFATNL